jgi:hypothetical protein
MPSGRFFFFFARVRAGGRLLPVCFFFARSELQELSLPLPREAGSLFFRWSFSLKSSGAIPASASGRSCRAPGISGFFWEVFVLQFALVFFSFCVRRRGNAWISLCFSVSNLRRLDLGLVDIRQSPGVSADHLGGAPADACALPSRLRKLRGKPVDGRRVFSRSTLSFEQFSSALSCE